MFRASLEAMDEIAIKLHRDSKQLTSCADELRNVITSLSEFSYMDDSSRALIHMKSYMEEEASQAALLGQILSNVQNRYWQTDRRAEEYCEEESLRMPREEAGYQDVTWMTDFISGIIL